MKEPTDGMYGLMTAARWRAWLHAAFLAGGVISCFANARGAGPSHFAQSGGEPLPTVASPTTPPPSLSLAASPAAGAAAERAPVARYGASGVWVELHINGAPAGLRGNGGVLRSGDRLQLHVQTRAVSHVYLAYCSHERKLTWFPQHGSLAVATGVVMIAPDPDAAIVLDDNLGAEVLYAVVSRQAVSIADPELGRAIERARAGAPTSDCGEIMARKPKLRHPPPAGEGHVVTAPSVVVEVPTRDRVKSLPPPVELLRGGFIQWGPQEQIIAMADASGIVIVRYSFQHVR